MVTEIPVWSCNQSVNQKNVDVFLISPRNHILWVLIGIASLRQFQWVLTKYVFVEKYEKYLSIVNCDDDRYTVWNQYDIKASEKVLLSTKQCGYFFLFLLKNIHYEYSFKSPHWGDSNEYPHHMFSWRNACQRNIYLVPHLVQSYDEWWWWLKYQSNIHTSR